MSTTDTSLFGCLGPKVPQAYAVYKLAIGFLRVTSV